MAFKLTEKVIEEITTKSAGYAMLEQLKVSRDGIQSKSDIKARLLLHMKQSTSKQNLQCSLQDDKEATIRLAELYDEAQTILSNIDIIIQNITAAHVNADNYNWQTVLQEHSEKLKARENTILVAGEISSGKSSLINLLIGEDLLPTAVSHTTSCITIIRYGEVKKFVVYDEFSSEIDVVEEHACKEDKFKQQLKEYLSAVARNQNYKKVEVYWPVEFLKGGTCIVDSPGIGENAEVARKVYDYYESAFAFIYVINSSNAGGIQMNRLPKLVNEICKFQLHRMQSFNPESAIFVCNKWDRVEPLEQERIQKHTYKKLINIWPGCRQEQIYCISTKNAMKHYFNGGYITDDYGHLLNGLEKLIPISSKRMIELNWRELHIIFKRSIYQYRIQLNNMRQIREEVLKQEMITLLAKLNSLKSELTEASVKQHLFDIIDNRARFIVEKLYEYLQNSNYSNTSSFQWDRNELPADYADFKDTELILQEKIQCKVMLYVSEWEREHKEIENFRNVIHQCIRAEFGDLLKVMRQIEYKAVDMNGTLSHSSSSELSYNDYERELGIVGASGWLPVTIVVRFVDVVKPILFKSVSGIKSFFEVASIRKAKYKKNPIAYIQHLTETMLSRITEDQIMKMVLQEHVIKLKECIDNLFQKLPRICTSFADLMQPSESKSAKMQLDIEKKRQELEEMIDLYNRLNAFSIIYLKKYDYYPDSILDINKDLNTDILGKGRSSVVVQRYLKLDNQESFIPIALKVFNEGINLNDIVKEASILRDLKHDNIIKLYGTICIPEPMKHAAVCLILELCESSLYEYVRNERLALPGKFLEDAIARKQAFNNATLPLSRQIAEGVSYLHRQGYIHRNLSLDTILISTKDRIKLTGIGLTKSSTKTFNNHYMPILIKSMAPEVLERKDYNIKSDVYSMANIFWELWYGYCIITHDVLIREHLDEADDDDRLPLNIPPAVFGEFALLMQRCWLEEPVQRLSSEECLNNLLKIHWQ